MTTLEKNILKTIKANLENSMKKNFVSGYAQEWSQHSKKMEQSIKDASNMLNTLISETENPTIPKEQFEETKS